MSQWNCVGDRLRHLRFEGTPRAQPAERYPGGLCHSGTVASCLKRDGDNLQHSFITGILRRAGLEPESYRARPLLRRMQPCLRALRAGSVEEAERLLRDHPRLVRRALDVLLLGVTEFFRDPAAFESLRVQLPALAADSRRLRIWSAACSDGSELYSVAMWLAEMGLLAECDLLGTDCRPAAIEHAREGRYGESAVRGVPLELRQRHFERENQGLRVSEVLRASAAFRVADLFESIEPGPWDLILWRNTAIYINPLPARMIWAGLAAQLRPGGLLMTGKAEQPDCRGLEKIGSCIYRKRQEVRR